MSPRTPFRLQCEQFKLTRLIRDVLAGNELFDIVFGARVETAEQDDGGISIVARLGGTFATFRGVYLVGADGAHSVVRKSIGEELSGETYPLTSLTVSVDFPFELHIPGLVNVNYVWTENGHFSLMRLHDVWRVGYSPPRGGSIEEAKSAAVIEQRLQAICPNAEPYRVTHKGAYTIHRRLANSFRVGRILLAGDAAHLNSPTGGMGMNSGIHDAANLADKLARVLAGEDDALLDRYARQRRVIAAEDVQAQSDKNYSRQRESDPARREVYWTELKETASDATRHRGYLLNAAMIASVARSDAIA